MNNTKSSHFSDFNVLDSLSNIDMIKIDVRLEIENNYGWSSKYDVAGEFNSQSRLADKRLTKELTTFSDANLSDEYLEPEGIKNEVKLENKDGHRWSSKDELEFHVSTSHDKETRFHCILCNYVASQSSSLKTHVSSIHNEERRFHCTNCNYVASENGSLKKYVSSIHDKKNYYNARNVIT